MEKRVQISLLLAFYAPMLTQQQHEALRLYYEDDLSLAEIAAMYDVSRQGAFDTIRRGEKALFSLEGKLNMAKRWSHVRGQLLRCKEALCENNARDALLIITELLREEEGQDGV